MNTTILVVEDNTELATFVSELLQDAYYTVFVAETGAKAMQKMETTKPDLILLDLNLPDVSGKSILTQIKDLYPELPVLILTASNNISDLVKSFGRGADDYLTKPFDNKELLARISARLSNSKKNQETITVSGITINTSTVEVLNGNTQIEVTPTEFSLLHYLMVNANRVLSREQILAHVWEQNPDIETRVVDVYIGYLRKKLENTQGTSPIKSKRGFGYLFKSES